MSILSLKITIAKMNSEIYENILKELQDSMILAAKIQPIEPPYQADATLTQKV